MNIAHLCPRRSELGITKDLYGHALPEIDHWRMRDGHRACSWCGSLHPDDFMQCAEAGSRLTPTDKNYKVYVDIPDPNAGKSRILGTATHKVSDAWMAVTEENHGTLPFDDWQKNHYQPGKAWVLLGETPLMATAKFYFQHLSDQQKTRFVELMNGAVELNLAHPGRFYVVPFFVERKA